MQEHDKTDIKTQKPKKICISNQQIKTVLANLIFRAVVEILWRMIPCFAAKFLVILKSKQHCYPDWQRFYFALALFLALRTVSSLRWK